MPRLKATSTDGITQVSTGFAGVTSRICSFVNPVVSCGSDGVLTIGLGGLRSVRSACIFVRSTPVLLVPA